MTEDDGQAPKDGPRMFNPEDILGDDLNAKKDEGSSGHSDIPHGTSRSLTMSGAAQPRMGENFDSNGNISQHIEKVRGQLGLIGQFLHDREVRVMQRTHVAKLAKELFRYQFDDLQHHLMLNMDIQKKRRFVQYMESSKEIQHQIQSKSAESQTQLINTLFDSRLSAYEEKANREARFADGLKRGKLTRPQYLREVELSEQMFEEHLQRIWQTAEDMIANHSKFLYATLALFESDIIKP